MRLCLQTRDLDAINAAAAMAFPKECCGLLVGEREAGPGGRDDNLMVARIVAATNIADEPRRRFEVDPAALFETHRAARAAGQTVIGHYHSHPGADAAPSAYDEARAFGDGEVWLIVAVDRNGVVGAARAHMFEGGAFREIEIVAGP